MFPVTLEDKHGAVLTVWPPCYGFLQLENYSGGDEYYDDDDDYDPRNTYDVTDGSWNIHLEGPKNPTNVEYGRTEETVLEEVMSFVDIKYIWNSGTRYPMLAFHRGEDTGVFQYNIMDADTGDERPKSSVEIWAEENGRPDVTAKSVLLELEAFMDQGRPSCMVWHEDGFMGVTTDVPADRCLFYLMVDRSFYSAHEQNQVKSFLDNYYNGKMSILQALAFSRIFCLSKNMFDEVVPTIVGNDYDSCILPMSLYTVGIARTMTDPRKTPWRQQPYIEGAGHLRDDDYPHLTYEGVDLSVNNSMFMPVLHPKLNQTDPIKDDCLLLRYMEEISLDERTRKELIEGRWNTRPNTHTMIGHLYSSNLGRNERYNTAPMDQWENIITNLFFGI